MADIVRLPGRLLDHVWHAPSAMAGTATIVSCHDEGIGTRRARQALMHSAPVVKRSRQSLHNQRRRMAWAGAEAWRPIVAEGVDIGMHTSAQCRRRKKIAER